MSENAERFRQESDPAPPENGRGFAGPLESFMASVRSFTPEDIETFRSEILNLPAKAIKNNEHGVRSVLRNLYPEFKASEERGYAPREIVKAIELHKKLAVPIKTILAVYEEIRAEENSGSQPETDTKLNGKSTGKASRKSTRNRPETGAGQTGIEPGSDDPSTGNHSPDDSASTASGSLQ